MPKWEAPGTFRFARLAKAAESRSRANLKRTMQEISNKEMNKAKVTLERRLKILTKQKLRKKTLVPRTCKHGIAKSQLCQLCVSEAMTIGEQ